ncbi:hypothetical protein [Acinetobacter sp. SA01]|uniref:hypothetical protein n=1 Tax=Acinetobacter sp. SA01 TaxID=1862567 RepID=UPI00140BE4A2|nr:hypothetical protein [Acinetobacter sp. SA01]
MFLQHNEYLININNINYIKSKIGKTQVTVVFEGELTNSDTGYHLSLKFESEEEKDKFLEQIKKIK